MNLGKRDNSQFFGKTKIVQTLGTGKFIYMASTLPLPNEDVIKTLYCHISNSIWNKKKLELTEKQKLEKQKRVGKVLSMYF